MFLIWTFLLKLVLGNGNTTGDPEFVSLIQGTNLQRLANYWICELPKANDNFSINLRVGRVCHWGPPQLPRHHINWSEKQLRSHR